MAGAEGYVTAASNPEQAFAADVKKSLLSRARITFEAGMKA
jgi:hypothetical protein